MKPKIYLFGDSITEESFDIGGWGASLANHFAGTVDVVIRGYSGYNTKLALKVLDKVFPEKPDDDDSESEPITVTVFFGANDACLLDRCLGFQHVPLHEYMHNLHSIVVFFKPHNRGGRINCDSFESGSLRFRYCGFLLRIFEMKPKIYLSGDSIKEASFDIEGWADSLTNHFAHSIKITKCNPLYII